MKYTYRIITFFLALSLLTGVALATSCTGSGEQDATTTTQSTTTTEKAEDSTPSLKEISVSVTVKDQYGNGIPNVSVQFTREGEVLFTGNTDEMGALAIKVSEGGYTVSLENVPEGYLALPESVTVSESSASFDLVAINNIPDGSVEKPFFVTENETQIKLPANASYTYKIFGNTRILTLVSPDLKVTYNETEYLPDSEGKISLQMSAAEVNEAVLFTISNTSGSEVTAILGLYSPKGYSDNPIVINRLNSEQTASIPRESTVYYRYEVQENGYLMVCSENKLNNISMTNLTTSVVTVFSSGSYCEFFAVSQGDEVQLAVASLGVESVNEIKFTLKQFKGDRSDPVEMGESSMAVRLAGGGSACFAFTGGGEYDTLVVKSSDIKVICLWNDEEYTPDGSGVVTVPLGDNGSQQYVFEMTNTSSSVREIAFELK